MNVESLISQIEVYNPDADFDLLRKSCEYSEERHSGQQRRSGHPYFTHCVETAQILIDLKLDISTICAGLLHDVLEDTLATREELSRLFGETITELVEGVTKIGTYHFRGRTQQRQADNYLKLLLATAKDIRVILIKLSDRLHNMETLSYQSVPRQQEIAKETVEIYAPLAHRLGIAHIKSRLEDLGFKYLYPAEYREIARLLAEKLEEREAYTHKMEAIITQELERGGIKAKVYGRPKHIYSIYQKIHQKGVPFEEIWDLTALRILVETTADCYAVLGILHSKWKHIPERFKDFIGLPKANGYRSLHTTILDRDRPDRGRPAEIQIRAFQMHEVAEYGIAAHWSYKEGVPSTAEGQSIFTWLRQMLEDIRELKNPYQFIQSMKWELFPDEVYVFTPKGDLFALPAGSTPIDFAYKVHSDVGQTCCGVEVNGMIVPLRYRLQNGDRVKILTNSRAHPSRDWLRWVKTARARERIRRWFRERNRGQAIELGRTFLKIEMRRQHLESTTYLKSPELLAVAEKLKMRTIDDLLMQIGNGTESAEHVVTLLHPEPHTTEGQGATSDTPPPSPAIQLEGIDIALVRIMKCCNPIPGDEIIGYITRGRGVSIHRTNCPRIINETERIVNVEWKAADQVTYPAEIAVQCDDRPGMLGEIATIISQYKVNIVEGSLARPEVLSEGMAQDRLTLAVNGTEQLEAIMESIRCLKGVRSVRRVSLEN